MKTQKQKSDYKLAKDAGFTAFQGYREVDGKLVKTKERWLIQGVKYAK